MFLNRTLDRGRNTTHIQFETGRKVRSSMSNFYHSCTMGVGWSTASVGDRKSHFFSNAPSNSQWFKRFVLGVHKRMGDVCIPDRALLREELMGCLNVLEGDWDDNALGAEGRLETALTGALMVVGFGASLRGEELPQIDVGGIRKHWREAVGYHPKPHIPLVLAGRFKGMIGERQYVQPLAIRSNTGIPYRLWVERTLKELEKLGVTSGPMFRVVNKKSGKVSKATIGDLDVLFHSVLKRVQALQPEVIAGYINVEEDYSVKRSLRQGSTTEGQNRGIPTDVIEANNRWRKHMHANGSLPSMSMIERYSDAKASAELLVRFSGMQ